MQWGVAGGMGWLLLGLWSSGGWGWCIRYASSFHVLESRALHLGTQIFTSSSRARGKYLVIADAMVVVWGCE